MKQFDTKNIDRIKIFKFFVPFILILGSYFSSRLVRDKILAAQPDLSQYLSIGFSLFKHNYIPKNIHAPLLYPLISGLAVTIYNPVTSFAEYLFNINIIFFHFGLIAFFYVLKKVKTSFVLSLALFFFTITHPIIFITNFEVTTEVWIFFFLIMGFLSLMYKRKTAAALMFVLATFTRYDAIGFLLGFYIFHLSYFFKLSSLKKKVVFILPLVATGLLLISSFMNDFLRGDQMFGNFFLEEVLMGITGKEGQFPNYEFFTKMGDSLYLESLNYQIEYGPLEILNPLSLLILFYLVHVIFLKKRELVSRIIAVGSLIYIGLHLIFPHAPTRYAYLLLFTLPILIGFELRCLTYKNQLLVSILIFVLSMSNSFLISKYGRFQIDFMNQENHFNQGIQDCLHQISLNYHHPYVVQRNAIQQGLGTYELILERSTRENIEIISFGQYSSNLQKTEGSSNQALLQPIVFIEDSRDKYDSYLKIHFDNAYYYSFLNEIEKDLVCTVEGKDSTVYFYQMI